MAPDRPCNLRLGPRKFKHFPKLPIELRLVIWELALPNAQLVSIKSERGPDPNNTGKQIITRTVAAYYKVPVLLHVSQEARFFAQSIYQHKFGDRLGGNGVWMDMTRDIMCFDDLTYDSMIGFFGCDVAANAWPSTNELGCQKPLAEQLPALAFKHFPWQLPSTPQAFAKLGRPDKLYFLRYSGRSSWGQERMRSRVVQGWQNNANGAKQLKYAEPVVTVLTYKKMNAELEEIGPVTKKKSEA
ncbi:hypothetical protein BDZ45DRAFT_747423 [Acephala macrosclerotiorum]|nr:hypothetical protein BDZ45DRAFT_747423 [Acephala macrosclerotiorum]